MSSRASYPTCLHVHANGKSCGSPSLRGEQFCFYHHPTRRPPVSPKTSGETFVLPPIATPRHLQIATSEIAIRIADGTLDSKRAGLLLQTLQLAAASLQLSHPH